MTGTDLQPNGHHPPDDDETGSPEREGGSGAVDALTFARACEPDYPWEPSWKGVFLRGLRAQPNVTAAARMADVSRARVYVCRDEDPVFAAVWEDALKQSIDLLAGFAHRMATTGLETEETRRKVKRALDPVTNRMVVVEEEEVTVVSQMVSPQMAMFLLRAHDPQQFLPPERRELTGAGGGPVRHEVYRQPSEERVMELARMLVEMEEADRQAMVVDHDGEPEELE